MSINISQIFVRYPDEKDAAALLASKQDRSPDSPSFLVAKTGSPWLAVCSGDNTPSPDTARFLSRALEAIVESSGCREVIRGNLCQNYFADAGDVKVPKYSGTATDFAVWFTSLW